MSTQLATKTAAAQHVGVDPKTVARWIATGRLPGGPWTPEVVEAAHAQWRATVMPRRPVAECGTISGWRNGCHCRACTEAHNAETKVFRDRHAFERWESLGPALCAVLADGTPYGEACELLGVTPQAITGHRGRDPEFAERLDDALMVGRDPDLTHGSASGWRHGCRCPECREVRRAYA